MLACFCELPGLALYLILYETASGRRVFTNGWIIDADGVRDRVSTAEHHLGLDGTLLRDGRLELTFASGTKRVLELEVRNRLFLSSVGYSADPAAAAPGQSRHDLTDPGVVAELDGQIDHGCLFRLDGEEGHGYVETGLGVHSRYRPGTSPDHNKRGTMSTAPVFDGRTYPYIPPADPPEDLDALLHRESEEVDPTDFEVLRHALFNVNIEHGNTIIRTSGSPVVVYAHDFNPVILDEWGDYVYFGPWLQYLVAASSPAVKWILENRHPRPGVEPGSMFMTNDPWIGATHQSDLAVLAPVFWEDRVFAWVGSSLHHQDLGGTAPGGFNPVAPDIFSESGVLPAGADRRGRRAARSTSRRSTCAGRACPSSWRSTCAPRSRAAGWRLRAWSRCSTATAPRP